ncbi:MAG TPA: amidohydrolase family protein [Puia sp.]|nr:amidohydrolase family protein [Puia sp.]
MKKILSYIVLIAACKVINAQETISPAPQQNSAIALVHGTVHVGNGEVIEDGLVIFSKGKITAVRKYTPVADAKMIDCSGKQVYPGLISPVSNLGLDEISAVRSTHDDFELGDINPNIRSAIAYNTDSKVINNVRSNGILLANIVPQGGIISGSTSVMQLDAWNWEDALYKADGGIYFNMPNLIRFSTEGDPVKDGMDKIEDVRTFFRQAKAYLDEPKHEHVNLKFEAVKKLFTKEQTFFVNCDLIREMTMAISFAKEFGFKTVVVGGYDSWKIADYLKQNNVAVILNQVFSLPAVQDDDIDMSYKTPYLLQQAGVLYCISDPNENNRYRNLAFNGGVATCYGLSKEQALQAITLNAAKILGIENRTGSIEIGKDANIVVSDGDILDIRTNNISTAFIQGRQINLDNKQKQLFKKYMDKYGLK